MLSTDPNKKIDKSFFCWCCEENVNYIWRPGLHRLALPVLSTAQTSHLTAVVRLWVDLSRISVNKGIKSRHGWTKYNDLYKIVHPSLNLIFLCLLTGVELWERFVRQESYDFCVSPSLLSFSHFAPELVGKIFGLFLSQTPGWNFSYEPKAKLVPVTGLIWRRPQIYSN